MQGGFGFGDIRARPAQPLGPVRLIRGHPLARGLVLSCFNSAWECQRRPFDLVSKTYGTGSGDTTLTPGYGATPMEAALTQSGNGFLTATSGAGYMTRLYGASFNGTSRWARFSIDLSASRQATFSLWMLTRARAGVAFETHATSASEYLGGSGAIFTPGASFVQAVVGNGGAQLVNRQFNTNPTHGLYHHYTIRFDRTQPYPSTVAIDVDGAQASTGTSGGSITNSDWHGGSAAYIDIGARDGGASAFLDSSICALNVWNRLLTDTEIISNYRDTFQMYEPVTSRRMHYVGDAPPQARADRWFLTG